MSEEMRDPRLDPRFLDKVTDPEVPFKLVGKAKLRSRTVEYVTALGLVVYSTERGTERTCSLRAWKLWAKGKDAQLASIGPEPIEHDSVPFDVELGRELTRLASRTGIFGQDQILVRALADLALAKVYMGEISFEDVGERAEFLGAESR